MTATTLLSPTTVKIKECLKENIFPFQLKRLPKKSKPLSPFVSKLKFLMSNSRYSHAIHWSIDERSIVITDAELFKRNILENEEEMFKTKNFTSFVRQLNLYGFRKIPSNGKSDPMTNMKFEHIYFRRERPDLMHLVQRTCFPNRRRYAGVRSLSNVMRMRPPRMFTNIPMGTSAITMLSRHVASIIPASEVEIGDVISEVPPVKIPLGTSMLQNVKKENEQNITICHDINDLMNESGISLNSSFTDIDFSISPSPCSEHSYAIPILSYDKNQEFDETTVYEYLNNTFNVEKEVVQTLLSFQGKQRHDVNALQTLERRDLDGLRTLAEVSMIFSESQNNQITKSQSQATPMETLTSS